ncbi:unnamed protein product [Toxocara canis]|uniref:Uncharacterized protein n=1 Tax=Toxocara canis TaxID=6265 RepID=A0A3P7H0R9_TOXCA|nr:unnamed protein product [Toxocara canis]
MTSLADSLRMMPDLCSDYRSAGFLLNEASDHWPIRCVWSGGEMNGTCIPSPLYNASITYVSSSTWRELVRTFRMTIGCSQEDIEKADKPPFAFGAVRRLHSYVILPCSPSLDPPCVRL